eukprot:m.110201 g.110201  ORF g.110201 m.110201 type:complete len:482 (-) comp13390_c0_seq2:1861-3306(-)
MKLHALLDLSQVKWWRFEGPFSSGVAIRHELVSLRAKAKVSGCFVTHSVTRGKATLYVFAPPQASFAVPKLSTAKLTASALSFSPVDHLELVPALFNATLDFVERAMLRQGNWRVGHRLFVKRMGESLSSTAFEATPCIVKGTRLCLQVAAVLHPLVVRDLVPNDTVVLIPTGITARFLSARATPHPHVPPDHVRWGVPHEYIEVPRLATIRIQDQTIEYPAHLLLHIKQDVSWGSLFLPSTLTTHLTQPHYSIPLAQDGSALNGLPVEHTDVGPQTTATPDSQSHSTQSHQKDVGPPAAKHAKVPHVPASPSPTSRPHQQTQHASLTMPSSDEDAMTYTDPPGTQFVADAANMAYKPPPFPVPEEYKPLPLAMPELPESDFASFLKERAQQPLSPDTTANAIMHQEPELKSSTSSVKVHRILVACLLHCTHKYLFRRWDQSFAHSRSTSCLVSSFFLFIALVLSCHTHHRCCLLSWLSFP